MTTKVSWPQKALTTKGHNHHLGSNDPRITSSQTFTSTNPRGESKPMHQNAMARTQEVLKFSLSNSNKATNAYGGIREEEQWRRNTKNSKISTRFPSLREEMDWCICRSRSPLSNPSKICKNHGRNQERGKLFQGQQWWEREGKTCSGCWRLFGEERGLL